MYAKRVQLPTSIPRLTSLAPQTKHIMTRAQIRTDDAEDDFEVLNCNDQELTLDDLVEIRQQSAPEDEDSETKKRTTTTVSKLTAWLGVTDGARGKDTASNEQREPNVQGIRRMLAFNEIPKKKKRSLSRHTSVLDLFKSHSDNRATPPAPLNTRDDNQHDTPTFLLEQPFVCQFSYFCKCCIRIGNRISISFLGHNRLEPLSPF